MNQSENMVESTGTRSVAEEKLVEINVSSF